MLHVSADRSGFLTRIAEFIGRYRAVARGAMANSCTASSFTRASADKRFILLDFLLRQVDVGFYS
jgi:hypothetical protein